MGWGQAWRADEQAPPGTGPAHLPPACRLPGVPATAPPAAGPAPHPCRQARKLRNSARGATQEAPAGQGWKRYPKAAAAGAPDAANLSPLRHRLGPRQSADAGIWFERSDSAVLHGARTAVHRTWAPLSPHLKPLPPKAECPHLPAAVAARCCAAHTAGFPPRRLQAGRDSAAWKAGASLWGRHAVVHTSTPAAGPSHALLPHLASRRGRLPPRCASPRTASPAPCFPQGSAARAQSRSCVGKGGGRGAQRLTEGKVELQVGGSGRLKPAAPGQDCGKKRRKAAQLAIGSYMCTVGRGRGTAHATRQ